MRGIVRSGYGAPEEVLSLRQDVAVPQLQSHRKAQETGLVVVKIVATAMSPADYRLVNGWLSVAVSETFPAGLGKEFAGVVVASSSEKFEVGDEVFGEAEGEDCGTFADMFVATEASVALKPRNMSFTDAAALPVAAVGFRAAQGQASRIREGRVLVLGGSAATGGAIAQLCKSHFGAAYVAATSSNAEYCLDLGCDAVYDYKAGQNWFDRETDFDVIFDCVGGDSWAHAKQHAPPSAVFVTLVPAPDGPVSVGTILSVVGASIGRSIYSSFGAHCGYSVVVVVDPDTNALATVARLATDGAFKPMIDSLYDFTLDNVVHMLHQQQKKKVKGRQICTIHTEAEALEGVALR